MTLPKVLIADAISQRGVDELARDGGLDVSVQTKLSPAKLIEIIPEFAALIVRSETKVTGEILNAATELRVVGRAGVGVDNVDVETATRRGVLVLNAPGGNTVSTAEHAFSLLLCVARKIPQADASLRAKKWSRKDFEGVELYNKTLGVIGMGRIGSELSRRAIAFGMRVIAYDPYLSAARARSLQVELVEELDDLLANADFISLHTPLTNETRHLLDTARISKTKNSATPWSKRSKKSARRLRRIFRKDRHLRTSSRTRLSKPDVARASSPCSPSTGCRCHISVLAKLPNWSLFHVPQRVF